MRTDATDSCRSTNARRLRWLRLLHQVRRDPLVRVPSERDEAHRWVTGIGRAAGDLAVVGVVVVAPEHELADELASWPTPPGWPSLRLLTGPAGRLHTIHTGQRDWMRQRDAQGLLSGPCSPTPASADSASATSRARPDARPWYISEALGVLCPRRSITSVTLPTRAAWVPAK